MMNALDLIENDFKVLANEMKKRYTNIREVTITIRIVLKYIFSKWIRL